MANEKSPENRDNTGKFKQGKSGNPGGRPKSRPFKEALHKAIQEAGDEGATEARLAGQPERISNALQEASGLSSRLTPDELIAASQQRSQGRINQAYETAKAAGHDLPLEPFNGLLKSQKVKDALNQGIKLSRERAIAQGGTNNASRLSAFDEAKKVLDGQAQPALGQPQTNEQAISSMLAKRLRETVDDNVPEYGGARALAQQARQSEDAIRLGADGAKANIPLDLARRIEGAHQHSDEIAQGFASGKIGQVLNTRPTAGTVDRFFSSPQQQETVQAIFKDKAPEFLKKLDNERTFNNTHRALTGNSTTARQLSEMLKFGIGTGGGAGIGAAGSFATGNDPLTGAAAGAAIGAGGRIAHRAGQNFAINQTEKAAPILARILTGHKVPKQLTQSQRASREELSQRIRLMLTGGANSVAVGVQ